MKMAPWRIGHRPCRGWLAAFQSWSKAPHSMTQEDGVAHNKGFLYETNPNEPKLYTLRHVELIDFMKDRANFESTHRTRRK
jgi:hypothetical protein